MEKQPLKRKKPTDSPTKDAICVSCKKNAAKNAIECDRCSKWEHKTCAHVSDDMYGLINNVPKNIKFFCTPCCAIISTILEVNVNFDNFEGKFCKTLNDIQVQLSNQIKELEQKLQNLDKVDRLTDQIAELESKIHGSRVADQLTNQIKEMEVKLHKPIEQQLKSLERVSKQSNVMTMDTASKVVDEYRDLERRKYNLIAFNVSESKSIEPSQRKTEDRKFFKSLTDDIGVDSVEIIDVVRLGTSTPNKLRPLRIQFAKLNHRRSVLVNAKKLQDSSSDVFKGIYINPDLSVRERQAQKKLRLELARRKENGESNIFIRRGRIVKQRSPSQPRESTSEAMEDQSG